MFVFLSCNRNDALKPIVFQILIRILFHPKNRWNFSEHVGEYWTLLYKIQHWVGKWLQTNCSEHHYVSGIWQGTPSAAAKRHNLHQLEQELLAAQRLAERQNNAAKRLKNPRKPTQKALLFPSIKTSKQWIRGLTGKEIISKFSEYFHDGVLLVMIRISLPFGLQIKIKDFKPLESMEDARRVNKKLEGNSWCHQRMPSRKNQKRQLQISESSCLRACEHI